MSETEGFDPKQPDTQIPVDNSEEDPQDPETVQDVYLKATKFLETGLTFGPGSRRMVQVQGKEGPMLVLFGIVPQEVDAAEIAAQSLGEPLVTITVIPTPGVEDGRDAYGIGINPETGKKYMELRPYDLETPPEGTYKDPELTTRFEEQQRQDHLIDRGLGKTRISEEKTREIRDLLEKAKQVSKKGPPLRRPN